MSDMMQAGSDLPLFETAEGQALTQGMRYAEALRATTPERQATDERPALSQRAMEIALASVSAALIAVSAQCRRASPAADITEAVTDSNGNLVYRCTHPTPHYWKLDGTPI